MSTLFVESGNSPPVSPQAHSMNLSVLNKIFLLSLLNLPVDVLFPQPVPERCQRPGCLKIDSFPLACLAVSIRRGRFKTIHHKGALSLVVDETPHLRRILTFDGYDFWIPRRAADCTRFYEDRKKRSHRRRTFRPPAWMGDKRPAGVQLVEAQSNFPSKSFAQHLVDALGFPADAAQAFFTRPWVLPERDRRGDPYTDLSQPDSPSRRTRVGGGLTEAQVNLGLQRMRTNDHVKGALFEIVYRRRGTLEVSREYNLPVGTLYKYATRLRRHVPHDVGGIMEPRDLRVA